MLAQAIGDFLPAAVAVALSPIPIVAIVLVLGTRRAGLNGAMFALGWVAGLAVVSVVVTLALGGADKPESDSAVAAGWLKIIVGAVFWGMAAAQWRKRPQAGVPPAMPGWMATLSSVTPMRALGLGAALSAANPKNLALTLTASASIAQAGLGARGIAVAVAAFVAIGALSVVGAVGAYFIAGERAAGPLASIKAFMLQHNAVIMMVVLLVLGAKFLGDGVAGFRG